MKATTITAYAYSQSEAGAALGGSNANKCTVEKEDKQVNKQADIKLTLVHGLKYTGGRCPKI